jgi:hypothetical protein
MSRVVVTGAAGKAGRLGYEPTFSWRDSIT